MVEVAVNVTGRPEQTLEVPVAMEMEGVTDGFTIKGILLTEPVAVTPPLEQPLGAEVATTLIFWSWEREFTVVVYVLEVAPLIGIPPCSHWY